MIMVIKRTVYSKIIDTLIFIWTILIMSTTTIFFLNIDNDLISKSSVIISLFCSTALSMFILEKYASKFPFRLTLKDKTLTIHRFLTKKEIQIQDIVKVLKNTTMSSITGSITFRVLYREGNIMLNNKRYKELDKLIHKIDCVD